MANEKLQGLQRPTGRG